MGSKVFVKLIIHLQFMLFSELIPFMLRPTNFPVKLKLEQISLLIILSQHQFNSINRFVDSQTHFVQILILILQLLELISLLTKFELKCVSLQILTQLEQLDYLVGFKFHLFPFMQISEQIPPPLKLINITIQCFQIEL